MSHTKRAKRSQADKSKVLQIRSVHRAIDILSYLSENGPAGLQELHVGTNLSKGALRRLLATLADRRFIRMGVTDGIYRTNVSAPMAINSRSIMHTGHLVEVARPHLISLTERIGWPSDLHLYNRGRMRILESTHGMTQFGRPGTFSIDNELNIFASASGLALLASRDDTFTLQLIDELKDQEPWSLSCFPITPTGLLEILQEARRKGFATRRTSQSKLNSRNSIAVAIYDSVESIGAITLSWHRKLATADEFAARHLDALRAAADEISHNLRERREIK